MLRFSPPPEPLEFRDKAQEPAEKIRTIVSPPNGEGREPLSDEFKDIWRDFKAPLLKAQLDKCGYCEQKLSVFPGDVEHYAPKALLQKLPDNKKDWGYEDKEGTYSVKDRRLRKISDHGYWWRAYDWSNYLAACNRCNSGWKRNLFPVDETLHGDRPLPPFPHEQHAPLLLNPFGMQDPAEHFEYNEFGQIDSRNDSSFGRATIDVCGLDRPSLVANRGPKAARAHYFVRKYLRPSTTDEDRTKILRDFILEGTEREPFAGMVRTIYIHKLQEDIGYTWEVILGRVVQGLLEEWADEFMEDTPAAMGVLYHGALMHHDYLPGDVAEILAVVTEGADRFVPEMLVYAPLPIGLSARIITAAELRQALDAGVADITLAIENGTWLRKRDGWEP